MITLTFMKNISSSIKGYTYIAPSVIIVNHWMYVKKIIYVGQKTILQEETQKIN